MTEPTPTAIPTPTPPVKKGGKPPVLMAFLRQVPTFVVLGALGAVAVWGHRTGWTMPRFSELSHQEAAHGEEDWCAEHNVPESVCIACNPELVGGNMADWCKEHGVAESRCTICHPEILISGIAADWCREHGLPESSCTICHAEIASLKMTTELGGTKSAATATKPAISKKERPEPDLSFAVSMPPAPGKDPKTCQNHAHKVQFASAEAINKVGVKLAYVTEGPITQALQANAELGYDRSLIAQVSPRSGGAAWKVFKELGQPVKKGELMLLVESAEVGKLKAELLELAAVVDSRGKAVSRLETSAGAGFRTTAELQEAQAALKEAQVRSYNARQALIALGLSLSKEEAEKPTEQGLQFLGLPVDVTGSLNRETTTANLLPVFAPQDGIITARGVTAGEIVELNKPLFTITDTRKMWMTLDMPAEQAARAKLGQSVAFQPDGQAAGMVAGVIDWISTAIDDQTRTLKMRAVVENADGRLRANTFGRVDMTIRETPSAILVPTEAIQWEGCCHVVFVRLSETIFQTRKVRIGARAGGMTEIMAGVLPGEVVTSVGSSVLLADILKSTLGAGCADHH